MPYPRDVVGRRRAFDAMRAGARKRQAAAVAGVSYSAVLLWCHEVGGVLPQPRVDNPRFVTRDERYEIARLNDAGTSVRGIARALGRDPSTVSRELRRNLNTRTGRYQPERAHTLALDKRRRPKPRRLEANAQLRAWVQGRLEVQDSPEQIAGRLPIEFPGDPAMRVSHETIYQAIYLHPVGLLRREVRSHLRTGRSERKPRAGRAARDKQGPIPDPVSIHDRPEEVEQRLIPGHFEGDLIMGGMASNSAMATVVERVSGFTLLTRLPNGHGADSVAEAITEMLTTRVPEILRKTLTWDRGKEMARHRRITEATGVQVYFADPYSPYQRGTNENTNGLLRQYFPKGSDLSIHDQAAVQHVEDILNDRPRKRLGFRTPREVLASLLTEDLNNPGVATLT
jgi:IS30 family transposase